MSVTIVVYVYSTNTFSHATEVRMEVGSSHAIAWIVGVKELENDRYQRVKGRC